MTTVIFAGGGFFLQPLHLREFVGLPNVIGRNYWRMSVDRLLTADGTKLSVPVDEILLPFDRLIARKERYPYHVGDRFQFAGTIATKRFSPDKHATQAGRRIIRQAEHVTNVRLGNWLTAQSLPEGTRRVLERQLKHWRLSLMQGKITFAQYQSAEMRVVAKLTPELAGSFATLQAKQREDMATLSAALDQLMPETLVVDLILAFKRIYGTGVGNVPFNDGTNRDTKRAGDPVYQRERMQTWEREYNYDMHYAGGIISANQVARGQFGSGLDVKLVPWQSEKWEAPRRNPELPRAAQTNLPPAERKIIP